MLKTQPKPHCFVALYAGDTIAAARLVAASTDPDLLALAAARMKREVEAQNDFTRNPALQGTATALRIVQGGDTDPTGKDA